MNKKFLLLFIIAIIIGVVIGININLIKKPLRENIEIKQNKINIVGLDNNNIGVTGTLETIIRDGNGLVLVNINDILADYSTQYSARIAALAAGNYTKINLTNYDVIYNIKINASLISGQSAGSSMAIATIALLQNKELKQDVMLTGSINDDGTLGDVGGVFEKATAAKNVASLFLIPKNSLAAENYIEAKTCNINPLLKYCKIDYKAEFNITGIKIVEVNTVEDALKYYEK